MNDEKYTEKITVDNKSVQYYQNDNGAYICKVNYQHIKMSNIHFSVKKEEGIEKIKEKAHAMIQSADRYMEKFGHIEIKTKEVTDMRVTIVRILYFPDKCWFFRYFKYRSIKGFIIRIFGFDINVREHDVFNKIKTLNKI